MNSGKDSATSADHLQPSMASSNPGDGPNLQITNHRLNGRNFIQWSRSVLLVIRGRGKMGYLTGDIKQPSKEDLSYATWELNNSMVMAWLINSMEPHISRTYLFLPSAQAIWRAVNTNYSDLKNASQVFEIKNRLKEIRQGNLEVTEYYNDLQILWQELDLHYEDDWGDLEDYIKFKKHLEKERLYEFLAGLNRDLDEVRGRILGYKPLPSLDEAFADVRREESRRRVMLGIKETTSNLISERPIESTALAVKNDLRNVQRGDKTGRPWCSHCSKPGHTRDTCWDLHGKPANWKSRGAGRGKAFQAHLEDKSAAPELNGVFLSKSQLEQLQKLLSQTTAGSSKISAMASGTAMHTKNTDSWMLDSGASDHMTGNFHLLHSYTPYSDKYQVKVADGSYSTVAGKGSIHLSDTVSLHSVLYVPALTCNLISVSKITEELKCSTKFSSTGCEFQGLDSRVKIGNVRLRDGLYYLTTGKNSGETTALTGYVPPSSFPSDEIMLRHYRLGHPNFHYLKKLYPDLFINKNPSSFTCEFCLLAKHCRAQFPAKSYKPSQPFSLVHSDIWGPSRVRNVSGTRWFITFTDDHTRVCWVYLLKEKSEAAKVFQLFHSMILTQFHASIQTLRTDNGREYFNSILSEFLAKNGIIHQSSCSDTPQQNGVAERKNRHLVEVARALMFTMNVPKYLWGEAILTASYLINRMPSKPLNFSVPLTSLLHLYPNFRSINSLPPKIFGCTVYIYNHSPSLSKLEPKSTKCVFVGYSPTQRGYKCYSPHLRRFFVSMDASFLESQPFFPSPSLQGELWSEDKSWDQPSIVSESALPSPSPVQLPAQPTSPAQPTVPNLETLEESRGGTFQSGGEQPRDQLLVYSRRTQIQQCQSDSIPSSPECNPPACEETVAETVTQRLQPTETSEPDLNWPIALRKGIRTCTQHPISKYVSYARLSPNFKAFTTALTSTAVPNSIEEALTDPNWRAAVEEEMAALRKNHTWDMVKLPAGKKPVGCKWVFSLKYNSDGSINRYKSRLVAKGFTQTHGIDYQETFAPVAKLNTIRVLLSLAANLDWPLFQLDIKNAFLNGDLHEEVYMTAPPGFKGNDDKVCKLKKSLYGLKQSPREWFDKFTRAVKKKGFTQAQTDHTLFYKHSQDNKISVLIVYVDDIIVTGDDLAGLSSLKEYLSREFELKDLGTLRYFLGMEVARSSAGVIINQRKYVMDLLQEVGMLGCKPADTPMDPNSKLELEETEGVNKERYQKLVGKLIYLSHTRPDITFAVSMVSRFMHSPQKQHLAAVTRILRYLKSTPGKGLFFRKNNCRMLEVYTDADWAGSSTDRRSTSGYCTYLWGNLVTWRSKKQPVVARSSAEAEFRALAQGICEGIWLERVLRELQMQICTPMKVYCDNKAAILIAQNPVHHDRTKHVEVDRHFIKEKLDNKIISLDYIPTREQTADLLTKGLHKPGFENLVNKLGMINIYSQLEGECK